MTVEPIHVHLKMDGKQIAQAIRDYALHRPERDWSKQEIAPGVQRAPTTSEG